VVFEFDLVFPDAMNTSAVPTTGNFGMTYSILGSGSVSGFSWTDANTLRVTSTDKPSNGESGTFEYAYSAGTRLQFADGSAYPDFEINFTVSF